MHNASPYEMNERWQILERVQLLSELNRHREAILLLQKLLAQSPDDGYVLCLLAGEHLELGEAKEALAFADRAVTVAPDVEWGHRLRSIALIEFDRVAALQAARQAAFYMPEGSHTLHNLVDALLANGALKEAWQTSEKLYALYPDDAATYETLASVAFAHEWYKDAERLSGEALKRSAGNPHAHFNRGAALYNLHRYDESAVSFARAVEIDPTNSKSRAMVEKATGAFLDNITATTRVAINYAGAWVWFPVVLWFLVFCILTSSSRQGVEAVIAIASATSIYSLVLLVQRHLRWQRIPRSVRRIYLITRWSWLRKLAPTEFDRVIQRQTEDSSRPHQTE